MSRYPIYQIDFSAVAAGKHVASSKRRIKWRFGFPSEEALQAGQTGTACRGEEHDVVIVWSVTSGKRQIMMDGREVHFSTNRTGVLEHSWSTKGNHVLKVLCHAAPPISATPGFRQYDFFVDGQSFFTMPKVYEVGLRGNTHGGRQPGRRTPPPPSSDVRAPTTAQQEEEDLQRAIKASLEESRVHLAKSTAAAPPPQPAPAPAPVPTSNMFVGMADDTMSVGMGDPTNPYENYSYAAAAPAPVYGAPPVYGALPPQASFYQPPAPATPSYPTTNAGQGAYPALAASDASYGAPYAPAPPPYSPPPAARNASFVAPISYTPAAPAYGAVPAPPPPPYHQQSTADLFPSSYTANLSAAPAPDFYDSYAAEDPFAPKPLPPQKPSDINRNIVGLYSSASPTPGGSNFQSPDAKTLALTNGKGPQATLSMNSPNVDFSGEDEKEPENPFEAAMKNLVNFDHIDQPADAHLTLKKQQDAKAQEAKKGKSKALPPAAKNVVGTHATLAQISEIKGKKEPKIPVMNPPPTPFNPQAQQAGMMVVYGSSPNPEQNGPPPLQPQGFGVGYVSQGFAQHPGYGGGGVGYRY